MNRPWSEQSNDDMNHARCE